MEEKREGSTDQNIPRMLNFNAPLLSTRRLVNPTSLELPCTNLHSASRNASERIPFSWEQAPGKPKDLETRSDNLHEQDTPRPKLPPSWRPPPIDEAKTHDDQTDDNYCGDGCNGEVDDDNDDIFDIGEDDVFSDAIDVFSLSEAIDIVERSQKNVDAIDGLKLKLAECRGQETPNFIIQRFLPDATALAASSALSLKCHHHPETSSDHQHGVSTQSYSSPKGCGLEAFFPWRLKHKLCGVKSPVRHGSVGTVQHQRHVRHKRHGSSA